MSEGETVDKNTRQTQSVLIRNGQRVRQSMDYTHNQCKLFCLFVLFFLLYCIARYYHPTPPPDTVFVIHKKPEKSKDACCWGWYFI